jgi:tetratricopeptide (TPR) repeat protein
MRDIDELLQIISANPEDASAHAELGKRYSYYGDPKLGLQHLSRAVFLDRTNSNYCVDLGRLFQTLSRPDDAAAWYRRALAVQPACATAYSLLGELTLSARGRRDEAIELLLKAIRLDAKSSAYKPLGECLIAERDFEEALRILRSILPSSADLVSAYDGVNCALTEHGRYDEARQCNKALLESVPNSADALCNLGLIATALHDMEAAISHFEQSLRLDGANSRSTMHYIHGLLMTGDYERARVEFMARRSGLPKRSYKNPTWDGEAVERKDIVLHSDGGFGDAIQFVRFAQPLHEEGARVVVKCREPLLALTRTMPRAEEVIPITSRSPVAHFESDADWVFMYRPLSIESISRTPYLFPVKGITRWKTAVQRRGGLLNIGLQWRGRDLHLSNPYKNRSLPLSSLAPLLAVKGVKAFSLQKGTGVEELYQLPRHCEVESWGEQCGTFQDLANAIEALDLVISVDTSIAHLAGALNKPVWVLLAFTPCDWRWQLDRQDTPWYPSARLFRQKKPGQWSSVVQELVAALTTLVATAIDVPARTKDHKPGEKNGHKVLTYDCH